MIAQRAYTVTVPQARPRPFSPLHALRSDMLLVRQGSAAPPTSESLNSDGVGVEPTGLVSDLFFACFVFRFFHHYHRNHPRRTLHIPSESFLPLWTPSLMEGSPLASPDSGPNDEVLSRRTMGHPVFQPVTHRSALEKSHSPLRRTSIAILSE